MSRDDYPYPEDEFDTLGADRTPQGVHRAPVPRWRQLLPFLIVLILAPTLAFVVVRLISGGEDPGDGATTAQETTTVEPTDGGSETTTEEPTDGASTSDDPTDETVEPDPDLDYATQIWVLNGSGVSGIAADTVTALEEAGWQDANAADYSSSVPSTTTLYYDNADQADEAEAVAEQLGITSELVESSDAADGDIVIVLRTDFQLP